MHIADQMFRSVLGLIRFRDAVDRSGFEVSDAQQRTLATRFRGFDDDVQARGGLLRPQCLGDHVETIGTLGIDRTRGGRAARVAMGNAKQAARL